MAGDRVLTVRLAGDAKGAVGALGAVDNKATGLGKRMLQIGGLFAGLNIGANVARDFLRVGMTYQKALNIMQAASGATAETMDRVSDKAQELGSNLKLPGVSAADAATAMTEVVKSGFSVAEAMDAAEGSLALATAAQVSAGEAANIMSDQLSAFALEGKKAAEVADILANVANESSGEITDHADAMRQASAVWHSAGMDIDDLATSLGVMARAGIRGSDAGTSLKTMLIKLFKPTATAQKALDKLGVSVYDAQGNMIPFSGIVEQFTTATKGMSDETRNAALATIFGTDSIRAANTVLTMGEDKWLKLNKAIRTGAGAQELAQARSKGLGGAMDALNSQLEGLYIVAYEKVAPVLERVVRAVAKGVGKFTKFTEGAGSLADSLNNFDGAKAGKAISNFVGDAIDTIKGVGSALYNKVKSEISKVDWVGLGIELGKMVIPMLAGIALGILNTDFGAMLEGLANNWQAVLIGILSLVFMPAKWAAGLAKLLAKIPFVGKLLSWIVKGFSKIGTKIKGVVKKFFGALAGGWRMEMGKVGPGLISTVVNFLKKLPGRIKKWGGKLADKMGNAALRMGSKFGRWLANHGPKQARSALIKIKNKILGFFAPAGKWLVKHATRLAKGIGSGIRNGIGWILGKVRNVKDRIVGFFSGAGRWLVNAGKSIVSGLASGIRDKAYAVVDEVKGMLSKARNLLPFSPAKEGPFSGKGWTLYSGRSIADSLAQGLNDRMTHVRSSANALAKAARPEVAGMARMGVVDASGSLVRTSGGLGVNPYRGGYMRGPMGGPAIVVKVDVHGNVIGEKDFAKRVTPTIREELVKVGNRNGGDIFGS